MAFGTHDGGKERNLARANIHDPRLSDLLALFLSFEGLDAGSERYVYLVVGCSG